MVVTRLPYGEPVPESPEGACSAAAVVVAWMCVGFVTVVAALAHSVAWTVVGIVVLVAAVVCTVAAADQTHFRADSTASTGLGEDDEPVGSW